MESLYPLMLQPALHTRVWGGRRLETVLGKDLPTHEPYGESWEMHDTAVVANGALAGLKLGDLLPTYGVDLIGAGNDPAHGVPLLLKFLDARDWLSVQVHPNDEQARALEGDPRGKTEAWYVIAAEPGAQLVMGVQPGTTRESMAAAIRDNQLDSLLVYVDVTAGDVLYMAAGTVHALGPGLLIYEIQQSSDVTYRLYDWGRMGLDGKPRALHVEKGVSVASLDRLPEIRHTGGDSSAVVELVSSPYFMTRLHRLDHAPLDADSGGRFQIMTVLEGGVTVTWGEHHVPLHHGRTALIPAALGRFSVSGVGVVLISAQP
jgi:mannose-6-phosphate isomerase